MAATPRPRRAGGFRRLDRVGPATLGLRRTRIGAAIAVNVALTL